jgi:hypothetical protein
MEESHAQQERRSTCRYPVDESATLVLLNAGTTIPGRMCEIGLEGCRIRPAGQEPIAIPAAIELIFKMNGIAFRLGGVLRWIENEETAGVQFGATAPLRRAALEELLAELEAKKLAEANARAEGQDFGRAEPASASKPIGTHGTHHSLIGPVQQAATGPSVLQSSSEHEALLAGAPTSKRHAEFSSKADSSMPASRRERRQETRRSVDTHANLLLIDVRAQVPGRILDVSMGGCRIRTAERFPVGIYRRVETEFKVDGLPFRLAGVVQSLHDRFTVGIRFLDMSARKREQLPQLMEEIEKTQVALDLNHQ